MNLRLKDSLSFITKYVREQTSKIFLETCNYLNLKKIVFFFFRDYKKLSSLSLTLD